VTNEKPPRRRLRPKPEGFENAPALSDEEVDPRRVLWRDSASILVVVVIVLLAARTFLPNDTGGPVETAIPSGIVVGSLPPDVTLAPGQTLGPIIDPSLGIDATPTPVPVITLGPSPAPTPKPTKKPTPIPTDSPTNSPTPAAP
jgi:hypothetical protein